MHARPANKLVQFLSIYKSKVMIKFGDKEANAKSIINLMSLQLAFDSEVSFTVEGEDEEKASVEIQQYLEKEKF